MGITKVLQACELSVKAHLNTVLDIGGGWQPHLPNAPVTARAERVESRTAGRYGVRPHSLRR